jgi:hypothetical protein
MSKVEKIEREIEALSAKELAEFRAWFVEFDWSAWDRQLAADVTAGRLDQVAESARREHAAGQTRPL